LSRLSHARQLKERGFTLVELLVVIVMIGIVSTGVYTFINTSVSQYLALQSDGMLFGDLASQSQRIAQVLRGLTDITQATATDITAYAYFAPNDANVSQVHYYKNIAGTVLYADVTPMTANPPSGSLITTSKQTYTIISNFYSAPGVSTFVYLDSSGNPLAMPVSDLHTIKNIQINLAVPSKSPSANGNEAVSIQVNLRNRKTNL
jgi:prepilin-type N-terminal cleavage/methylation domain-containing protein